MALLIVFAGCLGPDLPRVVGAPAPDDEPYAPGWPSVPDASIRPGVGVGTLGPGPVSVLDTFFGSSECTANFVFHTPDNRTLYLGTASHCLVGYAVGDRVSLADGLTEATIAYCSWGAMDNSTACTDHAGRDGSAWWNDFALLQIDDGDRHLVHPAMFGFGGPTHVAKGAAFGDRVLSYGNSSYRDASDALDAREGYVWSHGEWITEVQFLPPGIPGDSGSPVLLADGSALGLLKYLVGVVEPKPVTNGVVNLDHALESARDHGLVVDLATWTLLDPGSLPPSRLGQNAK